MNEIIAHVGDNRLRVGDNEGRKLRSSSLNKMLLEQSSDPDLAHAELEPRMRDCEPAEKVDQSVNEESEF